MFDYSDDLISDYHKEVYGFRPTQAYMQEWNASSPSQKQKVWDEYGTAVDIQMHEAKEREQADVQKFEARIQDVINIGAANRTTALEWIADSETFYHGQDVEHFVWQQGFLCTNYGRRLVEDLLTVVKYEEYA